MKARDNMFTVGGTLKQVLHRHPAFSANPIGDWGELAGEMVARYSQPKSLKKKVLVIVAYDSVWKHHLELNKEALMEKINGKHPEPLVEKIVIQVGEVPESTPVLNPIHGKLEKMASKAARARKKKKTPQRPLTPEEKALLKRLPDPELRTIGAKLLKHLPLEDESEEKTPESGEGEG